MSENLMPHIRLPKDLDVDCALLPGDPARADTVASHLEDARLLASNREFRSWQGTYKGKKMLVTSTGIGAASCAIAVEELIQCGVHNLIRIGSCGALQPECAGRSDLCNRGDPGRWHLCCLCGSTVSCDT